MVKKESELVFRVKYTFGFAGDTMFATGKASSEKKSYLFYDCHPVFNFQSNWTPFCLKPTWPLRPFVSKSTQYKVSFYPHYLWEVKAKRHLAVHISLILYSAYIDHAIGINDLDSLFLNSKDIKTGNTHNPCLLESQSSILVNSKLFFFSNDDSIPKAEEPFTKTATFIIFASRWR